MANAQKLPSGNWRVRVFLGRDENGKQIFKSFIADSRWKVEKAADEFIKSGGAKKKRLTIGMAIDAYIEVKKNVLAPSTVRGYTKIRTTRLQELMDLEAEELDSIKMQKAINEDATHLGWKSCKEAYALVMTALKMHGIKPDINVTFPAKRHKIKELPTAETVIGIVKGADVELPCLLAMWLSCRMSEIRGIRYCDIKDGVLTIRVSNVAVDGKDRVKDVNKTYLSTRRLMLPKYIADMIAKIPHENDTDFVVNDTHQNIYRHFKKLMTAHDIDMSFHDLRHLSASVMLMLGVPDKYAMERGGWSTNDTLKRVYQHTFSEERKQVDMLIDGYFNNLIERNEQAKNNSIC